MQKGTNEQENGDHDKQGTKDHRQRHFPESKHSLDQSRFYGIVVSTFDLKPKDPNLTP